MGSNEEYLDKLLQSVSDEGKTGTVEENKYSEDMTDEELLASLIDMYEDELAEFKTEEIIHKDENDSDADTQITESVEESVSLDNVEEEQIVDENAIEDLVNEAAKPEEIAEEAAVDMPIETILVSDFSTGSNERMSQSDIEALLSSLQSDTLEIPDEVNEDVLTEDSTDEVFDEPNAILDELLSASDDLQVLDAQEADMIIPEKENEVVTSSEDNLLKEMGIESMSEEQIDELLNAAATSENQETVETQANQEMDLNDLFGGLNFADDFDPDHKASEEMADLLGGMLGGNDDLAEIDALLKKADSDESVDDSNLRNILDMDEDIGGNDLLNELLQADTGIGDIDSSTDEENNDKKPKKEKKQKAKKEKQPKPPKEPKQPKEKTEGNSILKKITSVLFEEEEDLDDGKTIRIAGGDGEISFIDVDENEDILAELMNEDMAAGKKSKKKKGKGKPDNNKKKNPDSEDGEEVIDPKEQAKLEKKKQKAEKAAAKKKAKEEKAEADRAFLKAQPSISTKRAMTAFLFAMSIMAVILIIYIFVPTAIDKANARKAYYNKDYYEAFELLKGKELNDSDTILLNKVTCILKMQRKLDSYNNYVKLDKELEALNSLVEAVKLYDESYTYAKALSIDDVIDTIYDEIVIILNGKYGVSEEAVKEIIASESDEEYTVRLQYLIERKSWGNTDIEDSGKPMEDVLPEEEDFLEGK